jgi:hypothetical protein
MPLIRICEARESSVEGDFAGTVSIDDGSDHAIVIRSPFDETQEAELDWYFEEHLRRPYLNQVKAGRIAQSLGGYGESLFKQVFGAAEIYAEYVQQRNQLDQVSVEIEGTPAFHALHWEALKDPSLAQPLALQVPIVRRLRVKQAIPAQPRAAPALRLLMVIARPHGRKDVGYRTITRPLVEALRSCTARVDIDILRPGTYRALDQHLNQVRNDPQRGVGFYHVIHFDVHGALLTHAQLQSAEEPAGHLSYRRYGRAEIAAYPGRKAFVFLEGDETDAADAVEASELATLLTAHQIPITVLNACQSGKQVGASETSLGSHLLAAGAQLVLAMAYSVTVTAAQRLMINLYEQLFDGAELATAIRGARRELYNDKQRRAYFNQHIELEDWLLPVVYQHREVRLTLRELTPQESQSYFERRANSFPEPATTYGFFGRDLEVLEIERRLLCHSLLLVHGMGGAGKTTLLKHLGHWWQTTDFVREVFYFGYDAKGWTRQQIMSDIALQLLGRARYYGEFEPLNEPAQQALLAERLRGERHLVILDNLESITGTHLAIAHGLAEPEREALQSWLASLSGGRTLVLLGSRSEEAWLAPGTFVDNRYELQGLDGEAASNLADAILERVAASKARSYRVDADFVALLTLLAGFPLALQVILSNLARQTPSEVLAALRAGDVQLDQPAGKDKTQSILLCVDYAYGRLDADAQALLRCFAPFSAVINERCLPPYIEQLRQHAELTRLPFERLPEVLGIAAAGGLLAPDSALPGFLRVQPVLPYFLRGRLAESEAEPARAAIEAAYCASYAGYAGALRQLMRSQRSGRASGGTGANGRGVRERAAGPAAGVDSTGVHSRVLFGAV